MDALKQGILKLGQNVKITLQVLGGTWETRRSLNIAQTSSIESIVAFA